VQTCALPISPLASPTMDQEAPSPAGVATCGATGSAMGSAGAGAKDSAGAGVQTSSGGGAYVGADGVYGGGLGGAMLGGGGGTVGPTSHACCSCDTGRAGGAGAMSGRAEGGRQVAGGMVVFRSNVGA